MCSASEGGGGGGGEELNRRSGLISSDQRLGIYVPLGGGGDA